MKKNNGGIIPKTDIRPFVFAHDWRFDEVVAGIGVKFVMQNYSQNSNNYFENMLGETANIRCSNVPYFQIFIIPEAMPYYKKNGEISKWETFTQHNAFKHIKLSEDNAEVMVHTPTKTLLFVISLPQMPSDPADRNEYNEYYRKMHSIPVSLSKNSFGRFQRAVFFNDYDDFADKVVYYVKAM